MKRIVIARASKKDMCITLLRNSQFLYDIEIDKWINGQVQILVKDNLTVDQAFDFFDYYVLIHELTVK